MSKHVNIIPLGGVDGIGKNLTVFEYKNEIVIVDCGLAFPDAEMLGIDIVIPDTAYLMEKKDKIQGIFITHGHEDHIGALPYVMKEINCPIYGSELSIELIRYKFAENGLSDEMLKVVRPRQVVKSRLFRSGIYKGEPLHPGSVRTQHKNTCGHNRAHRGFQGGLYTSGW